MNEDQFERAEQLARIAEKAGIQAVKDKLKPNGIKECIDCGAEIPEARKLAMPSAVRCIICEEERRL